MFCPKRITRISNDEFAHNHRDADDQACYTPIYIRMSHSFARQIALLFVQNPLTEAWSIRRFHLLLLLFRHLIHAWWCLTLLTCERSRRASKHDVSAIEICHPVSNKSISNRSITKKKKLASVCDFIGSKRFRTNLSTYARTTHVHMSAVNWCLFSVQRKIIHLLFTFLWVISHGFCGQLIPIISHA